MRRVEQEQVNEAIKLHQEWLNTKGRSGKKADFSNCDLSNLDFSNSDLSCANFVNSDLRYANFGNSDLRYVGFRNTYLGNTKFYNTRLFRSDFRKADLLGANFSNANLENAFLYGSDLEHTEIFSFTLGRHFAFFHRSSAYERGNYLRIGCIGQSLEEWLEKYREIGAREGYSPDLIRNYGLMINLCKYLR